MTRPLFSIPLSGVGSSLVESFCSYVNRSARVHGVSPRQLIQAVANTNKDGQINGYSDYANAVTTAFCRLTGRNELVQGTLLRFRNTLAANCVDSITFKRRWCPRCIARDIEDGAYGYDPLIWSIEAVILCPVHDCWLVEKCSRCYSSQRWLSRCSRLHCRSCRQPLNVDSDSEEPSALEKNVRANLAQLFPHGDQPAFREEAMRTFLISCIGANNWLFAEAAKRLTANERSLGKLTDDPPHRPTLFTALQIAGACQQSLEAIFENPEEAAAQIRFDFRPPKFSKREHPLVIEAVRSRVTSALLKAAQSGPGICPRSVQAICRAYGVTPGFANYAFPHLVARISVIRKEFLTENSKTVETEAQREVRRWLGDMTVGQKRGISRKLAVIQLRKETGLPKRILAASLAEQLDDELT